MVYQNLLLGNLYLINIEINVVYVGGIKLMKVRVKFHWRLIILMETIKTTN